MGAQSVELPPPPQHSPAGGRGSLSPPRGLTGHAVDTEGPDAAVPHGRGEVGSQRGGGDGAALPDPRQALRADGRGHLPVLAGGARFGLAQVSRGRSS